MAKQKPPEPVDLELDAELEAAEDDPLVWALVARLSFRDFLYAVGRDKSGRAFEPGPVFDLLADQLEHAWEVQRSLSIVATQGIGKSSIIRLFLLWAIGRDQSICAVIASGDDQTATRMVGLCREIVARDRAYKAIFPEVVPEERTGEAAKSARGWKLDEFFVRRPEGAQIADPSIAARPMSPFGEAMRLDLLAVDDGATRTTASSELHRARVNDSFDSTWRGRLINGRGFGHDGVYFAVQNAWHPDDLGHRLVKDKTATSLWIGIRPNNGEMFARLQNADSENPLLKAPEEYQARRIATPAPAASEFALPLPANWTKAKLDAAEQAVPAPVWARMKRLVALHDSDRMFPRWRNSAIDGKLVTDFVAPHGKLDRRGRLTLAPEALDLLAIVWGVDFAALKRAGDALVALGLLPSGDFIPLFAFLGRGLGLAEWTALFDDLCAFGLVPNAIICEDNALQSKLVRELERRDEGRLWRRRIRPFTTTGPTKRHEQIGLRGMAWDLEKGRFRWPAAMAGLTGPASEIGEAWSQLEAALDECPAVPKPGETPDLAMALWFAWGALQSGAHRPAKAEPLSARELGLP